MAWDSNLTMIQLVCFRKRSLCRKEELSLNLGLIQSWPLKRSFRSPFQRHPFKFHRNRICFLERLILDIFFFLHLVRHSLDSCIFSLYLMKRWRKHVLFKLWLLLEPESVDLFVASFLLIFLLIVFVSCRMMEKGFGVLVASTIALKGCPVFWISFHQE